MSGVTSADRQIAWNIKILQIPPKNSCIAGAFQFWQQPFLCWRDLFNDLILCFDLKSYLTSSTGVLALWVRNSDKVVVHGLPNAYISYTTDSNTDESDVLSEFINVGNVSSEHSEDPLQTQLHLSIVLHDTRNCDCKQTSLDYHLRSGCANPIELDMNPDWQYVPIPSLIGSHSKGPSATSSVRASPKKRSRPESLQESPCETPPGYRYAVPSELELNVKGLYNGKCVITGNSCSWGTRMVAGPGIETCHIIPKSMYFWHPDQRLSDEEQWRAVNSYVNCMAMDSVCHKIHDSRLLAVHHGTHRIRLFAPIPALIMRNSQQAHFSLFSPNYESLEWHYNLTVIENMCALLLDTKGGAKRMPWRKRPTSPPANHEEGNAPAKSKIFGSFHPDCTQKGAELSHASNKGESKEQSEDFRASSVLNSMNYSNPIYYSRKRHRTMSGSSSNIDMSPHKEFATSLYNLLDAEALYQEQREKAEAWRQGRREKVEA